MTLEESVCRICGKCRSDKLHNNTLRHRFHFVKWLYNDFRKKLISDRHGVTLDIEVEEINNFHFDSHYIKGKYITKVTPKQLQLHNDTITFQCRIRNNKKEPIWVINTNLLHPSKYFEISKIIGEGEKTYVKLNPGKYFPFAVTFKTNLLQCATYKIPLCCDFQTGALDDNDNDKDKGRFTIVRTFLMIVDDQTEIKATKTKSPFTSQHWKDVTRLVQSTKETNHKDRYPIPKEYIRLLDHGLEPFQGMSPANETDLRYIRDRIQTLNKENYAWFWHIILWMEERAQSLMLMKYNMEKVTMELNENILILEVPGLAEKRPSVIVGDFIKIRITEKQIAYKGFVWRVNEKTVEISHVDDKLLEALQLNPNTQMDVAFMLSRLALERMHHAVEVIQNNGMVEKLFPTQIISISNRTLNDLPDSQFYNASVCSNAEQRKAVNKIVNSVQDVPYIVFGPPGTGKTVTIVEAILQIKRRTKKKILVCAPANSACDMLATKLMNHCTKNELIRIHSSTRETTTITEELVEYSNIEDGEFTRVTFEMLQTYRIVVTTLTLIGRFSGQYNPDCVFVDEAAQASEPETDIAIALTSVGKQVVLAGDPQQLGPMATDCAAKYGLEKSLLERLMDYPIYSLHPTTKTYNNDFITMLRLNFRSHPDILRIPNDMFYKGLLEARSHAALRDPIVDIAIFPTMHPKPEIRKGRAIEFCSVSSKERKEGSSPSFFNLCESRKVVEYVQALSRLNLGDAYQVRVDQIGVVTPYKRQVHKIKEGLRQKGFDGVEVGTTESFQGREKRIIIISTVRAQHSLLLHDRKYKLGFVKQDKRFNVAITRAISKLIIIGSPLVLRTDNKWTTYMNLCQEFGTYFGNYFPLLDSSAFREDVIKRMKTFKQEDDQYKKRSK